MTGPSDRTIKRIFALSRNQCAYPGCKTAIVQSAGTVTGEICHIAGQSPGGPRYDPKQTDEQRHAFENLILLCSVHHRVVDDQPKQFTRELLDDMKAMHEREGDIELSQEAGKLAEKLIASTRPLVEASGHAQVMMGSPGGVQAHQVIIKTTTKKALQALPSEGAIGHNLHMRNYTLHLIERYNDFQKWDAGKSDGKYSALYRAIKKEFGAKWDFVPQQQFANLISYIQGRIHNSKLGRIKKSRGEKCFSTWAEWQASGR